ncbi:hypothetical protein Zmor_012559 [Zophobas morio]|uniref:Uncharacterized protein n=1 Tax=Zophobas morio TaxID=2755281 RepID=A0AA38MDU8_9CUCU|nr:hypothetical protein Zmor_012559 [Zophobas morio]
MDNPHTQRHKTVPIRRRCGQSSNSTSADIEGTFIPLSSSDSAWNGINFVNTKFTDDEDEDVIRIVDLQCDEKPPLLLLFPDLEKKDVELLASTTSTTQVAQILVGKKADFSLLKPSKKLNPEQCRLPPLVESPAEHCSDDEELGE